MQVNKNTNAGCIPLIILKKLMMIYQVITGYSKELDQ